MEATAVLAYSAAQCRNNGVFKVSKHP